MRGRLEDRDEMRVGLELLKDEVGEWVDSIKGQPKDSAVTQTDLAEIRACGYAINDEDLRPDWRCIAVPIVGADRSVRYSLGLAGTAARLDRARMLRLAPLLRRTADAIAVALARDIPDEASAALVAISSQRSPY